MSNQFLGSLAAGMGAKKDPLASLMSQQLFNTDPRLNPSGYGSPPLVDPAGQGIIDETDIVVEGTNKRPEFSAMEEVSTEGIPLNNSLLLEELAEAQGKIPQRKGMFGIKGTLRDILGTVGDAFLVQSGNKQVYAPQRERERRADALAGFTKEPLGAIEKLAYLGEDEIARELYKQVEGNAARAQAAAAEQAKANREAIDKGGRIAGQIAGSITDEASYLRNKPRLQYLIDTYGLGDFVKLPDTYDKAFIDELRQAGMPVNQQITTNQGERRLEQGDRRIDIQQQGQAERVRSNKAREQISRSKGGNKGSNPTPASIAAPLIRKLERGETLTPGQDAALRATGMHPERGSNKTTARSPLERRSQGAGSTAPKSTPRAPTIKW